MKITERSPDEDRPVDTNLKDRVKKQWKKMNRTSETCGGNIKMSNICMIGVPEGKERWN